MNWIKENKFLTGFFAVLLVGVIVLGALLVMAMGRYSGVATTYEEKADELTRLQGLVPYPSAQNRKEIEGQKAKHLTEIGTLQEKLGAIQLPVTPMSPEKFQDELRKSVTLINQKAAEIGMNIDEKEKFYLGFERYQSEPPRVEAAAPLGRQLKAIEQVMLQLIESRAVSLKKITRVELPEESDKPKAEPKPAAGGGRSDKQDKAGKGLVSRHPFEIEYIVDHQSLRNFLNKVVGSKTQFFIPRLLTVKNQSSKAPLKVNPDAGGIAAPPAVAPAPAGAPAAPGTPPAAPLAPPKPAAAMQYIVGTEKLEAIVRLEMVDFVEVAAK